jgi:hypothetical protein
MQTRLQALEAEVQRLRALNEKISLSVGSTPEAGVGSTVPIHSLERPLSPPPESSQPQQGQQNHNLVPITGEPPREDSSGSGSDGGY